MSEIETHDQNPLALLGRMDLNEIDPDKLEKLLSLQERWEDRRGEREHALALVAIQAEMPQIHKGRSVQGKYQYASYDDIMRVARPILQRHSMAVSFSQSESEKAITIVCKLTHSGGFSTETPLTIPKLEKIQSRGGADVTNSAQAMGSTLSYAKRYCLCNALDVVVTDEDDDGVSADIAMISERQGNDLLSLMDQMEDSEPGSKERFLKWLGITSIFDLPENRYAEADNMLHRKLSKENPNN